MAGHPPLALKLSEAADLAVLGLKDEDRRRVWAWFDHLENWHNDEFVRKHSRQLDIAENAYLLETSTDILIAFQIEPEEVLVLSIFRRSALQDFERTMAQRAS